MNISNIENYSEEMQRTKELAEKFEETACCGRYTNGQVLGALMTLLGWHLAAGMQEGKKEEVNVFIDALPSSIRQIIEFENSAKRKHMQ